MCFGGSSAKTDRGETLKGYGELGKTFDSLSAMGKDEFAAGKKDTATGVGDIGQSAKYYSAILSGDPAKLTAAATPELDAILKSADTAKTNLATSGTARTGGVAGANQDVDFASRGQVAETLAKERANAAEGLLGAGKSEAGVGLSETGAGIGATGSAGDAASNLTSLSANSRKTSQQIHDAAVQQWADIAATVLLGI